MKHRVMIALNLIVYNTVLMFFLGLLANFLKVGHVYIKIFLRCGCFYILTPSRVVKSYPSFEEFLIRSIISENLSIQHCFKHNCATWTLSFISIRFLYHFNHLPCLLFSEKLGLHRSKQIFLKIHSCF